ncbi:MAG: hypothetical protein H6550_04545 [Chitinophagales bacterium]|nr:hypothetical protein [Chitinophagales bacterium]
MRYRTCLWILLLACNGALNAQRLKSEPDRDTRVMYKHFDVVFYDYPTHNSMYGSDDPYDDNGLAETIITRDTITINEYGMPVDDRILVQMVPKYKGDSFKIFYSVLRVVSEQYDFRRHPTFDIWKKTMVSWEGYSRPLDLQDSIGYYYRLPHRDITEQQESVRQLLSLRDTSVIVPSEGGNYASVVYKERPAHFDLPWAMMKIERYHNGKLAEVKHIRLIIESGC